MKRHILTLESFTEIREFSSCDDWTLDESENLNESVDIDKIRIKSPKTGRSIKLVSALKHPEGSPSRKQAEEILAQLRKKQDKEEDKVANKKDLVDTDDEVKKLMPNADITKKRVDEVPDDAKKDAVTAIDKIAHELEKAKAEGRPAENTNLCDVSIPGTNMYCDGNKKIPRAKMPQFRGKPAEGSAASKMPKDNNGEVETSALFDKMLDKEGIKISKPTEVDASTLKATQAELVGPKVVGMAKAMAKLNKKDGDLTDEEKKDWENLTGPIYVSNDGYVVDGHHRWAAIVSHNLKNPDKKIPMKVRVIDDKIESIIPKANKFAEDIGIAAKTGKEGTKGGEPAAQTKK